MSHAEKFDCTRVSNCFREPFTQQMEYKKPSEKSDCDRVEEWIASDITLFDSLNSFCHAEDDLGLAMSQHQIFEQPHFQEFGHIDDLYLDVLSPPFQSCGDEIQKIINVVESQDAKLVVPKKSRVSPSESFEVLRKYSRRHLMDDRGDEIQPAHVGGLALSTEIVIKLAAEKFIQSMPESSNELSLLNHPYPSSLLTLSEEDSKEVQLVQNLLSCAEKVAEKQYERALKFLKECGEMNSFTGTPIQRLAFYISEALYEKIAKETGRQKEPEKKPAKAIEPAKFVSSIPVYFKQFPVTQITNLVGSQTILHYLNKARKIHIIDLEIRSGVQWVQLMQDVAARREHPIQHLKITAVGTKSKLILEETGRQLASFAESVKLKFTFKIVVVEDILSLKLDLFDVNADESVAVYAAYTLMTMIGRADRLNHLMGVIRNLCPCVMVVTEMEANCNSQCYIERFVESLFLFGALFDSLADCLKDQESSRVDIESTLFRSSINNVLAAEGEERMMRHVRINVWRAIFAGFELLEIEPSLPSLDQANLLLQHFSYGSSITLCRNDKCLTLGWKGTELTSLSAWKVHKY
ncbi:hypothetical protein C2S52_014398 [Perilla frutescens var. hirtella]|nr:hypothetical protein C2S52_014398 [Perilla frutescens var. hirtella]